MAGSKSGIIVGAGNTTYRIKRIANRLNQNSKLDMFKSIVKVIGEVEQGNKNMLLI